MTSISRRELLARTGRAGVALGLGSQLGWLTACGDDGAPVPSADPGELAGLLEGNVSRAGDPGYERASRLYITRFDHIVPRAIAYPKTVRDVQRSVDWARDHEVPIVARNGAHSYGGYSTVDDGLVVHLRELDEVRVDADAGRAVVGAGALLIDVYEQLARDRQTIPAGSCPTVGISGLTLGGGIGLSSRLQGLTIDSLEAVELVTADGDVVTASADENPDLFWALRGGGGGNFGIATEFTFRTHPAERVAIYDIQWPWDSAQAVTEAWQRSAPEAPDELFSICKLVNVPRDAPGPSGPAAISFGQWFGTTGDLLDVIRPLLDAGGEATMRTVEEMDFFDAQLYWAGCEEPTASRCIAATPRVTYKAKSMYFDELVPGAAIETMADWVERWPGGSAPEGGSIQLDASGGAINRVPAEDTAFVHRDQRFHAQFLAYWSRGDPRRVSDANLAWVGDFYAAMARYGSGQAYQNYIDPALNGWEEAYYGSAFERLREVKRAYDPDDLFRTRQSIPP